MTLLYFLTLPLIALLAVWLSGAANYAKSIQWWMVRLLTLPTISILLAIAILWHPLENPAGYDPLSGSDAGPASFVASLFLGVIFPVLHTILVAPLLVLLVKLRNRP